jgi:hypothetical protein
MRNKEKTRISKTAKIAATAAAAYGAYKLGYHMTAKTAKKPTWYKKDK